MNLAVWVRGLVRPFTSRKVRVAVATVLAAYAAEHGLAWSEELVLTVVSVGVALMLGIAHEDAGKATGGQRVAVRESGDPHPVPLPERERGMESVSGEREETS